MPESESPEYEIGNKELGFRYDYIYNRIVIAMGDVNLTDDELLTYVSDSIVHETIHRILLMEFGSFVSGLFDTIGHHMRDYAVLKKYTEKYNAKFWLETTLMTYPEFIRCNGFRAFLSYQGMHFASPEAALAYARKICSRRVK